MRAGKYIFYGIAATVLFSSGCNNDPVPPDKGSIIVLMYHKITQGDATNLYERSVTDFESDLIYLIYNNINIICNPY